MKKEILKEQEENIVEISPEEYIHLLKLATWNASGLRQIPKFRGKDIKITGNLDLSNTDAYSLDGVKYIDGNLDISKTKISDISKIEVSGNVRDWGSGVEKKRLARIKRQKLADANSRRENDEWNMNNEDIDEEGIAANALIEYFSRYEDVEVKTDEDRIRMQNLVEQLDELLNREKEFENNNQDTSEIILDIEAIEEQINEINEKIDVYDLIPSKYKHYQMYEFEFIDGYYEGRRYAVGTESDVETSVKQYVENLVDESLNNFSKDYLQRYIDEEKVLDDLRDWYDDWVRESPESYFDSSDYELTSEQEEEKERLEQEIEDYENRLSDYEEDSEEYERIQEYIDNLREKYDEIEPLDEPTEDMIENKVDEMVDEASNNLISVMEDFGMDLKRYIDEEEMIDDMASEEGYGIINSYDNSYDSVEFNDDTWIIMMIDK
jgi:DNA repair exonuclease SbcCD ATPase subunit